MSRIILTTILLLLTFSVAALATEMPVVDEEFVLANKFYEERDFASAIRLYDGILAQGVESAPLYFNLANAHFKNGDLGHAVLNYLRAQRLAPDDEAITANLEFARRFSSVQMEGVQLNPIKIFFQSLVGPYRLSTLAWLATGLFLAVMILMSLRYGFRVSGSGLRVSLVTLLIFMHGAMALTSFKYRNDYLTRRAVVVAEEAPVYTGPSENSDIELQSAPGLVVEVLEEDNGYFQVLFENKRRGWIHRDLVAEI